MNRRSILNLSAITALGLVVPLNSAIAQQKSLKDQLVGTWAFVSSTGKFADGSPVWGTNRRADSGSTPMAAFPASSFDPT
jgi:hypothetical protein